MANFIPHADLDPYATYHQQPSYPSYPHPVNFAPPHPVPEAQTQTQRYHHHAPQQQYYQVPNQAHGHGPSGSMPPPSTIPDSSFHRQHYPHPSTPRTPDRWPLGGTDDQRQLQEQYQQQSQPPPIHPNYHHPPPFSSPPSAGPVSTFHPPSQHRTSPQIQPPPQSPSSTSQKSQQPMTATTAKPVPPSNLAASTPPADSARSAQPTTAQPTLEAQRVTALLELNCVLLEEVVKDQAAQKGIQSQPKPQQTSSPSNTDAVSKSDPAAAPKQEMDSTTTTDDSKDTITTNKSTQPQSQPQNGPGQKTPNTKEYVEYMRRLQANLAYLANVADRNHKPGSAVLLYPVIMEAPNFPPSPAPSAPEKNESGEKDARENIKELYAKLRELWPEYKGKGTPTTQGAAAGMGTTSHTPATTSAA
ncbi:MAG: hypothetical protein Q9196_003035 [Gyalolechia fulgens]